MWFQKKNNKNNKTNQQHHQQQQQSQMINLQGFGTPMPPRRRSRFLFGNNHHHHHSNSNSSNSHQWRTSSPSSSTAAAAVDRPQPSARPQHRNKHHHHHHKKGWKVFLAAALLGGIIMMLLWRLVSFSSSPHYSNTVPATIHTQTFQHPYQACHLDPPWGRRREQQTTPNNSINIPSSGAPCTGPPPLKYPFTTATQLTCPSSSSYKTNNKDTTTSTISRTTTSIPPFDVAIAWTYYASPTSLLRQLDHYTRLLSQLDDDDNNKWKKQERKIVFLVVDDGSPPGLQAADYVTAQQYQDLPAHLQLVQIDTNIAWNQPGARNLAMHVLLGNSSSNISSDTTTNEAEKAPRKGLVLSLDIDVWIPSLNDLERLLTKHEQLSYASSSHSLTAASDRVVVAHSFNRTRTVPAQDDGQRRLVTPYYKEHPSALAMTALDWWQTTGGMDEDFAGHYGSEDVAFWWKFEQQHHEEHDSYHHHDPSSSPLLLPRRIRYHHEDIILQQLDTLNGGECDSQWIPDDLFSKCTRALENLPSLSRDANLNILKGQKKRKTGCWSNTFLRFPWHFVDRVGVVAPTAT